MSAEIATRESTPIAEWAYSAEQAARVASRLALTPFVPASLRGQTRDVTAANVTAAILTGAEIGLHPMASLRSINVISGTPALSSLALRAVVLAAGHDMWVAEATETRAVVRGRRRGSDQVQESVWTLDRASKLGLINKENWRRQPQAMLVARATAECARLIAPDAILGVPYVAEELEDSGYVVDPVPVAVEPPQRTARRRSRVHPAEVARSHVPAIEAGEPDMPEPELEPEPEPQPEPQAKEMPAENAENAGPSQARFRRLHATFHDVDVEDREDRLTLTRSIIGREIESSKELTDEEADLIVDTLRQVIWGNATIVRDENGLHVETKE